MSAQKIGQVKRLQEREYTLPPPSSAVWKEYHTMRYHIVILLKTEARTRLFNLILDVFIGCLRWLRTWVSHKLIVRVVKSSDDNSRVLVLNHCANTSGIPKILLNDRHLTIWHKVMQISLKRLCLIVSHPGLHDAVCLTVGQRYWITGKIRKYLMKNIKNFCGY